MTDGSSLKCITFLIDSKLNNVSLAGMAIRGICNHLSLLEPEAYYLELCVVEAVNNAIKHAYGGEVGHAVEVSITYSGSEITIEITDSGKPMDLYVPGFLDFDPEDLRSLPDHGMGLYIISSVMDDVRYESSSVKNTLTMRKFLYHAN